MEERELEVLVFRVAGERVAVELAAVEEVVLPERLHPLPDTPPELVGMLRLRGELIPVIDLAVSLALPATSAAAEVVLVRCGGRRIGVAVEALVGVASYPAAALRPSPWERRSEQVLGVAGSGASLVTVIDPQRILAGPGAAPEEAST